MSSAKKGTSKYDVGQKIVYPAQGVGEILKIVKRPFKNQQTQYYVIYISSSDMTVMIPCDKVDDLKIRPVVSRSTALNAIKKLDKPAQPATSDWKARYQNNIDLIKSGNINDTASAVASLYFRSKQKELPILERKLFDNAKKLLIDELSLAMKKSSSDVEDIVHSRLEEIAKSANLIKSRDSDMDSFDDDLEDFDSND